MRHRLTRIGRTSVAIALATVLALALGISVRDAAGQSAQDFANWMSVSGNVASGTLHGSSISLSGTNVSPTPASVVDGSSTVFNRAEFTPPLPTSDAIHFIGSNGNSYTLQFGSPVTNPVLHLGSLASTLQFPAGTEITRLSGDAQFSVSGSSVSGGLELPSDDANGSVRLSGTFTSISFSTTFAGSDGIPLQVGAASPSPPPPPAAPENVTAPSIREGGGGTYTCDPGTWNNASSFAYRWFLYPGLFSGFRQLADTQTYKPDPSAYGFRVGCTVTATGPGGSTSARSPNVVFSAAGINRLPPAYGDVRVRGIDVFQVVQPNRGAQMFGYNANATFPFGPRLCGGGTPTNFILPGGLGKGRSCFAPGGNSQTVPYAGVRLDRYKETTVMVYVDVASAQPSDPELAYDLELSASRNGRSLGQPVVRRVQNPPRSDSAWVLAYERDNVTSGDDNRHGIPVRLPWAWTSRPGSIRLDARLRFPEGSRGTAGYGVRQCDHNACSANDSFALTNIPIVDFPELRIRTLSLRRRTASPPQGRLRPPHEVLARARELFPGGDKIDVPPYREDLDITEQTTGPTRTATVDPNSTTNPPEADCGRFRARGLTTRTCRRWYVDEVVEGWTADNPARTVLSGGIFGSGTVLRNYDVAMGVHNYDGEPGWAIGDISGVSSTEPRGAALPPRFTATANTRPLSAAGHELGHVLTAPHTGEDCPVPTGQLGNLTGPDRDTPLIRNGANIGERWPPDNRGRLQGTKFDGREVRLGRRALLFRSAATYDGTYADASGARADRNQLFDLMSYCANEVDTASNDSDIWLSARNWNRSQVELGELAARLRRPATVSSAAAARSGTARSAATRGTHFARGVAGAGGGDITRIVPPDGNDAVPAPVPSSPFKLRSLDAAGKILTEAGVEVRQTSESRAGEPGTFVGPVAPGATAVELVRGGRVLDRAQQSRPPTVKLTAPRRGTRVRRKLAVRWRAADPDGQALSATVDYSPDGHYWRTIYDGPSRGAVTLPGSYLAGSKRARIRVSVNDGFTERSARSARFVAAGTRPRVSILSPKAGAPIRARERIGLLGRAYDDLGRPLRGRRLTWFAGKKRLGRGARLRARLPRGTRRLRLVARDRNGRTGVARVRVRVEVPRLRIVSLAVPAKVGRKARALRVRIQTSAPATLRVANRRFRLGRRARSVTVRLPRRPAVGILRIPFRISARGQTARGTIRGVFSTLRT